MLQSSCAWMHIPRGKEKRIHFGRASWRCRRVAAGGHMLAAACTNAHSLLCMLYFTYDCIYFNRVDTMIATLYVYSCGTPGGAREGYRTRNKGQSGSLP